jgi:hypothetical protein
MRALPRECRVEHQLKLEEFEASNRTLVLWWFITEVMETIQLFRYNTRQRYDGKRTIEPLPKSINYSLVYSSAGLPPSVIAY